VNLATKTIAVVLAVLLAACTDLGAVREWAATSMEGAQFNEIVATYADTPRRLVYYDEGGASLWETQAKTREAQAKALDLQLSLVADYMAALAALSADSVADYTKDAARLTDSLQKTGQVSEATLGAAGKLATTIANAAAKLWQKKKVGALIEQADPPLQNLLDGELRSIVDLDFRRDLKVEAQFLDRHFEDLLRTADSSAAAKAALYEWFVLRKAENRRRMAAVDAYLGVLDKIAEGHGRLFDNRDQLHAADLAKALYKLAKEIRNNVKEIMKT
jgi:hypothetical protein